MKYIKTYKIFENINSDLELLLNKYHIQNYTINDDGTIDVNDSVNLMGRLLNEIPFKFGKVNGSFAFSNNQLTSLEGCPIEVGGNFYCSNNNLTSLEHCPSEIGGNFHCSDNKLTMLDCSSYVKGNIICYGMFIEEPEFFGDCEGKIFWKETMDIL